MTARASPWMRRYSAVICPRGNMEPAISVIIPVYNGCKYLREAISSVLEQNPAPLEVLVVDDGSSDRSAEVSGEFGSPVRVISQEHRGAGAARNNGVRNS